MKMKELIQLLLYCVASAGILINMFFHIKVVGFIGYTALLVASILQIIKMIGKK